MVIVRRPGIVLWALLGLLALLRWGWLLVGGLEPWNFMTFHSVGNFIIPTDELRFLRGVETTNQVGMRSNQCGKDKLHLLRHLKILKPLLKVRDPDIGDIFHRGFFFEKSAAA